MQHDTWSDENLFLKKFCILRCKAMWQVMEHTEAEKKINDGDYIGERE